MLLCACLRGIKSIKERDHPATGTANITYLDSAAFVNGQLLAFCLPPFIIVTKRLMSPLAVAPASALAPCDAREMAKQRGMSRAWGKLTSCSESGGDVALVTSAGLFTIWDVVCEFAAFFWVALLLSFS